VVAWFISDHACGCNSNGAAHGWTFWLGDIFDILLCRRGVVTVAGAPVLLDGLRGERSAPSGRLRKNLPACHGACSMPLI
jgi:hypothetical protein